MKYCIHCRKKTASYLRQATKLEQLQTGRKTFHICKECGKAKF